MKILAAVAIAVTAAGVSAETTEAEKQCIQNGLDRAEAIEQGSDSFLNGFVALLPVLKDRAHQELSDPYRCSRAKPANGN